MGFAAALGRCTGRSAELGVECRPSRLLPVPAAGRARVKQRLSRGSGRARRVGCRRKVHSAKKLDFLHITAFRCRGACSGAGHWRRVLRAGGGPSPFSFLLCSCAGGLYGAGWVGRWRRLPCLRTGLPFYWRGNARQLGASPGRLAARAHQVRGPPAVIGGHSPVAPPSKKEHLP